MLLRTYDPGFYFPEWDEGEQDSAEYPSRVHFAWGLLADPVQGLKGRVRRITYELAPIGPATEPGRTADGRAIREQVAGADGDPVLTVGDATDAVTGTVTRTYSWAPGKPSASTCYLTDAEWLLEDLSPAHDVSSLPADKAAYRVRPRPQRHSWPPWAWPARRGRPHTLGGRSGEAAALIERAVVGGEQRARDPGRSHRRRRIGQGARPARHAGRYRPERGGGAVSPRR
ncbi:hypothetical protein [Streptomyces griseofuscus]|uniref:hypothetical protein n=1 Tax=Streptomyces griseofuscus TaxID=146922 RepID=UPI00380FBE86